MENLRTEKIVDLIARGVGVIDYSKQSPQVPETDYSNGSEENIFPFDVLPEWLQSVVNECSISYRTPPELWASAFLCGISAASGKKFKLETGNYINYPQLWVMVIGRSGDGKSEAFRVAFRELLNIDERNYAKYQLDYQDWEQLGKNGTPPFWAQSIITDVTPEALFTTLSMADNGLTLYRDELSGWFKDIGRYNNSGEVGHYTSIFDNQTFSVNRKQERPRLISNPLMNICGTIQPKVLQDVLSRNNAEESGFAQRFLYLYPDFKARDFYTQREKPDVSPYNDVIRTIVEYSNNMVLHLSDEAEKDYAEFFHETEKERVKSDDFWAAVYSKSEIQALRLALTVKIARLMDEPDAEVSQMDMQAAIGITKYCISSLRKFKREIKQPIKKADVIRDIFSINPDANHYRVAEILNVSRPFVSKQYKDVKVTSYQYTKPETVSESDIEDKSMVTNKNNQ